MEIKLKDIETKTVFLVGYKMSEEKTFYHQIIYTDAKLIKWKQALLTYFPHAYYFVQVIEIPTFLKEDFTPF